MAPPVPNHKVLRLYQHLADAARGRHPERVKVSCGRSASNGTSCASAGTTVTGAIAAHTSRQGMVTSAPARSSIVEENGSWHAERPEDAKAADDPAAGEVWMAYSC
jgi:hypothetical protein